MPLTPEQQTALDALKGVEPEELADAFHTTHGKAAQVLIDQGDAGATKRAGGETRKLEKEITRLTGELEKAQQRLAENDPAKVHEQYQGEIRTLTTAHETEVRELKAKGVDRERARDLAEIRSRLATRLKPMALQAVLNDPATAKQLEYGEDGSRQVLQRGKAIPYTPSRDQDPLDLMADDLVEHVKAIDADSVLAEGRPGGGVSGGDRPDRQPTPVENKSKLRRTGSY